MKHLWLLAVAFMGCALLAGCGDADIEESGFDEEATVPPEDV
jgi:hypothetical protein